MQHRRQRSVDAGTVPTTPHVQWFASAALAFIDALSTVASLSRGAPIPCEKFMRRCLHANRRYLCSYAYASSAAALDAPRSTLLQPAHAFGCQRSSPSLPPLPSAFYVSVALFFAQLV